MFSILLMPILVFAGPIAEMQALGQNPAIYKKWAVYNKKCKSTLIMIQDEFLGLQLKPSSCITNERFGRRMVPDEKLYQTIWVTCI